MNASILDFLVRKLFPFARTRSVRVQKNPRKARIPRRVTLEQLDPRYCLSADVLPVSDNAGEYIVVAASSGAEGESTGRPFTSDTNGNGSLEPQDVLILINLLNSVGPGPVDPPLGSPPIANDIALEAIYQGLSGQVNPFLADAVEDDQDCDTPELSAEERQGPAGVLVEDNVITITPDPDFSGELSVIYVVTDDDGSDTGTITVFVTPNARPTVFPMDLETDEDVTLTGNLLGGDADGQEVRFVVVSEPANGTLVVGESGTFTYTPNANFSGTDSFRYKGTDGIVFSEEAEVTITVLDVVATADVGVTLSGPETGVDGQEVVYTVTVVNNGPDTATVTMTDAGPPGLLFVSTNDDSCSFSDGVSCTFDLESGMIRVITLTYRANNDASETFGNVLNQVAVSTTATDSNTGNNVSAAVTTTVQDDVQPECSDGEDNNRDGRTDFPQDPGCESTSDDTEYVNSSPFDSNVDGQYDATVGVELVVPNRASDPDGDRLRYSLAYVDSDLAVNLDSDGNLTVTALSTSAAPRTDVLLVLVEDLRDVDGDGVLDVLSSIDERFFFNIIA